MHAINCPVLQIRQVTPKDFVLFWEKLYPDSDYPDSFYRENIGKQLTKNLIDKWFVWKNGGNLSKAKIQTISRNFSPDTHIIDHDADVDKLEKFLNQPGGVIWRIFWLHLHHPQHFPIYDQHVHRAMEFLLKLPQPNKPDNNQTKIRNYIEVYRPFFQRFNDCEPRQVDRALWSFGRFLKSEYGRIATSPGHVSLT